MAKFVLSYVILSGRVAAVHIYYAQGLVWEHSSKRASTKAKYLEEGKLIIDLLVGNHLLFGGKE